MIATPLTEDYKRRSKSGKKGLDIVLERGGGRVERERAREENR